MKKILITITYFVFICLLLPTCKKEDISTFDTTASIYFTSTAPINQNNDSTAIGFGYSAATVTDSIFMLPVSVLGRTSSKDRVYIVDVDPASTAKAGFHYDLPANPVIRAGFSIDSLAVTFHRTPDLQTNPVTLILHLKPNENFNTDMKGDTLDALTGKAIDFTTYKLSVIDGLLRPPAWIVYYFGVFTEKKIRLMSSVTGMPLDALSDYRNGIYWQFWATKMNRYLADQSAAGNTILEDDGTPMKMGVGITG